eukprot:2801821-Rhodomonas_salina.2
MFGTEFGYAVRLPGGANGLQRLELSGNALGEAERKRVQSSLVEEAEGEREALLAQWLAAL